MNKNKEVIKHSSAIQITNSISFLQRRAWNVLLALAYDDLLEKEQFSISIKELSSILGFDSKNEEYLKDSIKKLTSTAVTWNILDKDAAEEWGAFPLLAGAVMKRGVLSYAFSPFLKEKLYNPKMYAKISLSLQNRFNGKHSLALYEICLDYYDRKRSEGETPFISLEKFRNLMGIGESEYLDFSKLNEKVIKKSISEITAITDLSVSTKLKRVNKKVTDIKFYITKKKSFAESLKDPNVKIQQMASTPIINSNPARNLKEYYDDFFLQLPIAEQVLILNEAQECLTNFTRQYIGTELEEKVVTPLIKQERNRILAERYMS